MEAKTLRTLGRSILYPSRKKRNSRKKWNLVDPKTEVKIRKLIGTKSRKKFET